MILRAKNRRNGFNTLPQLSTAEQQQLWENDP